MRGKYRQTFLLIFAEGEETNQSANLKVNSDRTLPIIVENVPTIIHSGPVMYAFLLVDPPWMPHLPPLFTKENRSSGLAVLKSANEKQVSHIYNYP